MKRKIWQRCWLVQDISLVDGAVAGRVKIVHCLFLTGNKGEKREREAKKGDEEKGMQKGCIAGNSSACPSPY